MYLECKYFYIMDLQKCLSIIQLKVLKNVVTTQNPVLFLNKEWFGGFKYNLLI